MNSISKPIESNQSLHSTPSSSSISEIPSWSARKEQLESLLIYPSGDLYTSLASYHRHHSPSLSTLKHHVNNHVTVTPLQALTQTQTCFSSVFEQSFYNNVQDNVISSSADTCYVFLPTNQKEVVAMSVNLDDTFEDLLYAVWKTIFPSDHFPNHTDYYFLHCIFARKASIRDEGIERETHLSEKKHERDDEINFNEIPIIPTENREEEEEEVVEMVERMGMRDYVMNCFSDRNPHPRFLLRSIHHGIEGSVVYFTTSQDRLDQCLFSGDIHPRECVGSCVLSKKGLKSLQLSVDMDRDMDNRLITKMNEENSSKGEKIGNVLLDNQKECDCCLVGQSRSG